MSDRVHWIEATSAHPCPVCAHASWCRTSADGATAHCHRVESPRPWRWSGGGWLHVLDGSTARPIPPPPPPRPSADILPVERRDAIYRAVLSELRLSDGHRQALARRGLDADAIARGMYRSHPYAGRSDLVRRLLAQGFTAEDLVRCPGVIVRRGRYSEHLSLAGAEGLLVPVRDLDGRIVALRLRPDDPRGGGKYRWLSSARHGGPSPGTPIHVARPATMRDAATVYVTEGELKADVAADRLGAIVVSVPGVSIRAGVLDVVRALGAKRIAIAFDADKLDNPHVAAAELALAGELRGAGLDVWEATWPADAGKGLDDLLVAGGVPDVRPFRFPRVSRIEVVTRERLEAWAAEHAATLPDRLTLDGARAHIVTLAGRAARGEESGVIVIEGSPGIGKTLSVLLAIQAALLAGELGDRRVLYLADTIEQLEELLRNPLLADLARVARIRYGRGSPEAPEDFCRDKTDGENVSGRLAAQRQWVMPHYCRAGDGARCEFAAACAEDGYLLNLAECEAAPVVFAAKALFGADPSELEKFSLVIVDEDLCADIFETVRVPLRDVDEWATHAARKRENIDARPDPTDGSRRLVNPLATDSAPDRFLRLLREAIVNGAPTGKGEDTSRPLLPALQAAAAALFPRDRRALVKAAGNLDLFLQPDKFGRFAWEWTLVPALVIPLRATLDLLDVVREDLDKAERNALATGNPADSRARIARWTDADTGETLAGIEVRVPRRDHLRALEGVTVLNLDATPNLPILRVIFPPRQDGTSRLRRVPIAVAEHVEVTQLRGPILVPSHLARILPRVNALLDAATRDEAAPVIFCSKRFNPDAGKERATKKGGAALAEWEAQRAKRIAEGKVLAVSNPCARFAHFDGASRGVNRYEDASLLVIVGHYQHPIDVLAADLRAVRAAFRPNDPAPTPGPEEAIVPYGFRAEDGSGFARWCRRDADPDVAAAVDWQRSANVVQTIGRGRPAADGRQANPLRVLLLTGYPFPEVRVSRLATLAELEAAAGVGVPSVAPTCPPHVQAANVARREALRAGVTAAVEALKAKGEAVTVSAVARELGATAGSARTHIAEHLAAQELAPTPPPAPAGRIEYLDHPAGAPPPISANSPPDGTCGNRDPGTRGNAGSVAVGAAVAPPEDAAVQLAAAPLGAAPTPSSDTAPDPLDAAIADWEERAAIREVDGGLSREEAQAVAWEDLEAASPPPPKRPYRPPRVVRVAWEGLDPVTRDLVRQAVEEARASPVATSA